MDRQVERIRQDAIVDVISSQGEKGNKDIPQNAGLHVYPFHSLVWLFSTLQLVESVKMHALAIIVSCIRLGFGIQN
jgi:hypothetical protein